MRAAINKYGFLIYWIVAVVDMVMVYLNQENYRYFTKPYLIPILAVVVFAKVGFKKHLFSRIIILLAFTAATVGDYFLLRTDGFKQGLISFLVVLLLYSIYFWGLFGLKLKNLLFILFTAALVGAFFAICITILSEHLGAYRTPLIIYSIFLSIMFVGAANLYNNNSIRALVLQTFIPGALLFIISDVTLAFNKFYFEEAFLNIAVMATYVGAQYYIASGFIRQLRRRKHSRHHHSNSPVVEPA